MQKLWQAYCLYPPVSCWANFKTVKMYENFVVQSSISSKGRDGLETSFATFGLCVGQEGVANVVYSAGTVWIRINKISLSCQLISFVCHICYPLWEFCPLFVRLMAICVNLTPQCIRLAPHSVRLSPLYENEIPSLSDYVPFLIFQ